MSNKIQGEGDYEAARRFNKAEQDFVKRKLGKKKTAARGGSPRLSGDDFDDSEANEVNEHDYDAMDGDTTQRDWQPGIESPDRK